LLIDEATAINFDGLLTGLIARIIIFFILVVPRGDSAYDEVTDGYLSGSHWWVLNLNFCWSYFTGVTFTNKVGCII